MKGIAELSELTGDYVLDVEHTRLGFVIRQVMISKVRGHFDEFEGNVYLDGDDPSKSSARLTIQAGSIQTRNQRRDAHLRKAYLDTANHPVITFISTKVDQADGTNFALTGNLTIRGMTQRIVVALRLSDAQNDALGNYRVVFEGEATIDRKDWGVVWNAFAEGGGALVSNTLALNFKATAIRRS